MVVTSYKLHDVSQGLVAVPLWIAQSGMALGVAVLFIAIVDDLIVALRGGTTSYDAASAAKTASEPVFER
jgi:hypothetical protein